MSIELELRLEGEDANEENLVALKNELQNVGLVVKRVELHEDKRPKKAMGLWFDPDVIVTVLQTYADFDILIDNLIELCRYKKILICPRLQSISDKLRASDPKIQVLCEATIEKIKKQFCNY